jgi:hypothetical protein
MHEARNAHREFRHGTMSDAAIEEEFHALHRGLLDEVEQGTTWELFQGNNLKRTGIVVGVNFFQQATGQAFASQYGMQGLCLPNTISISSAKSGIAGARFIRSLQTVDPFTITTINSGVMICVLISALLLSDRLGRRYVHHLPPCLTSLVPPTNGGRQNRHMLQAGALVQAGAMLTMGGLGLRAPLPSSYKPGIIAAFIFFSMGFAFGWAPLTYVVTTELPALRLRDRNQRVASLVNIFMNFLVNFTVPYLLSPPYANLQSKVGFIFGSVTLLSFFFVYFCVPECKGRTLEEIDRMFNEDVPLRRFRTYPSRELIYGENGGEAQLSVVRKADSSTVTENEGSPTTQSPPSLATTC